MCVCVCVCVCVRARVRVCDYTIEKYKKKICYHQKNNSNIKTYERPKKY